jgi:hypothetical protein
MDANSKVTKAHMLDMYMVLIVITINIVIKKIVSSLLCFFFSLYESESGSTM